MRRGALTGITGAGGSGVGGACAHRLVVSVVPAEDRLETRVLFSRQRMGGPNREREVRCGKVMDGGGQGE